MINGISTDSLRGNYNSFFYCGPYLQHTHTQPFNCLWFRTTRVGRYQKKHSPIYTHPDHRTSFIDFLHLLRFIASSLFSLRAWQSFLTTSLQVLFGFPLGLGPSTSYAMHFFTQSSSAFRSTCPYQQSLFSCNTNAMSSIGWLGSRVVSMLDWGAEGPGSNRSRDAVG